MLKQVDSPHASSPDDLLRSLDAEILRSRTKRENGNAQRTAVLAGGLLLILAGATVALCALFSTLGGLARPGHAQPAGEIAVSQR
jgi:hypothetical protein